MEQSTVDSSACEGMARPLYFICVASDANLPSAIGSMLEQPLIDSEVYSNLSNEFKMQMMQLKQKEQLIREKDNAIALYRDELNNVYNSHSWRYTSILRKIGNLVRWGLKAVHHL